jgi:DHA1 family bicyclomycin/chloramphenicol resistance-like MFS transporter
MAAENVVSVAAPLMSERRVSLIGAMLVAIGPVSMALYTPAMPEIVRAFGTTESAVKMTLTLYFGGFAFAQLIAGPLSDALGRRPIAFAFMGIYCAASLVALMAPSVEVLMAARFVQGVGASAGVAISRAVVRDLFEGEKSSRIMNLIGIILAVGPALAPTLGGALLVLAGWRSIFAAMAIAGLALVAVVGFGLRETVVPDRARLNPRALAGAYRQVLGNRRFLAAAGVNAGAAGTLFAQATFLPFILMDRVGMSPTAFGLGMLMQSGCFFAGSLTVRRLMDRHGAAALVMPGLVLIAVGCMGLLPLLVWEPSFLRVMGPVAVFAFGVPFVMPAMTTAALQPFPAQAGAASAMMGFMQMGNGLLVGTLGALIGDPVLAMGLLIPCCGVVAWICWLAWRRMVMPLAARPDVGRP